MYYKARKYKMDNNIKIEELVQNIYKIIDTYYDEKDAKKIEQLITQYIEDILNQGQ